MNRVIGVFLVVAAAAVAGCGKSESASQSQAPATEAPKVSGPAMARDQVRNAAPLGLEIAYANVDGVKEKLQGVRLDDKGVNRYSGGPMLESDGQGIGVDGLSKALFIFDKNNTLQGVLLTLPKNPKDMLGKLSSKYQVVDDRVDNFMNKGYAKLEKGDSIVEIDAPHLSFTMEVRYLSKQLMNDFVRQSAAEEAKKKQEQTDKL